VSVKYSVGENIIQTESTLFDRIYTTRSSWHAEWLVCLLLIKKKLVKATWFNLASHNMPGGRHNFTFMRHTFLVVTVKQMVKIAVHLRKLSPKKIKQGYHFFGTLCRWQPTHTRTFYLPQTFTDPSSNRVRCRSTTWNKSNALTTTPRHQSPPVA